MARTNTFLQKPPLSLQKEDPELYDYLNTLVTRTERILKALGQPVYLLGSNVDVNNYDFITHSAGDITLTPNTTGDIILDGLKWPQADGTANYVLETDGAGQLSWVANTGSGLENVVEDLTPQLGGALDVNAQSIVSVSAGDIAITPDTTGDIILDGLKWPQSDGTATYVLSTDGAGQLSWVLAGGGAPMDISVSLAGLPAISQVLVKYVFARSASLPQDLTGSQGHSSVAATAQTDFDIQKNAVSIGTVRWAAAATVPTFIFATGQTFAAADRLHIIAPSSADTTLSGVSITLKGQRT